MTIYLFTALGVIISVVLPLIRTVLPVPPSALGSGRAWEIAKPYVYTGIFSLLVAVLVVAAMGDKLDSWQTAVLAGYMWDSTMQKATTGNVQARAS